MTCFTRHPHLPSTCFRAQSAWNGKVRIPTPWEGGEWKPNCGQPSSLELQTKSFPTWNMRRGKATDIAKLINSSLSVAPLERSSSNVITTLMGDYPPVRIDFSTVDWLVTYTMKKLMPNKKLHLTPWNTNNTLIEERNVSLKANAVLRRALCPPNSSHCHDLLHPFHSFPFALQVLFICPNSFLFSPLHQACWIIPIPFVNRKEEAVYKLQACFVPFFRPPIYPDSPDRKQTSIIIWY